MLRTLLYMCALFKQKIMREDQDANTICTVLASAAYGICLARRTRRRDRQHDQKGRVPGRGQPGGGSSGERTAGVMLRRLYHSRQLDHSKD